MTRSPQPSFIYRDSEYVNYQMYKQFHDEDKLELLSVLDKSKEHTLPPVRSEDKPYNPAITPKEIEEAEASTLRVC